MKEILFREMSDDVLDELRPEVNVYSERMAQIVLPLKCIYGIEGFQALLLYSQDLYCRYIYDSYKNGNRLESSKYYKMVREELKTRDSPYRFKYTNIYGKEYILMIHPQDIPLNQVTSIIYYASNDYLRYQKRMYKKFPDKNAVEFQALKEYLIQQSKKIAYLKFHPDTPYMRANNPKLFYMKQMFGERNPNIGSMIRIPHDALQFELNKPRLKYRIGKVAYHCLYIWYHRDVIRKFISGYFTIRNDRLEFHISFVMGVNGTASMEDQLRAMIQRKKMRERLIPLQWKNPFILTRTLQQIQSSSKRYSGKAYTEFFPLLQKKYRSKTLLWEEGRTLLDKIYLIYQELTESFMFPIDLPELYDFCVTHSDKMIEHIQKDTRFDYIKYLANNYLYPIANNESLHGKAIVNYVIRNLRASNSLKAGVKFDDE